MARDRLLFLISFALLGLVGAFLFRRDERPPVALAQVQDLPKDKDGPAQVVQPVDPNAKSRNHVSGKLAPGKRAVPFELNARSGIAQFMTPGMYVDLTFTSKPDSGFGSVSLNLIKNVRILAIGVTVDGVAVEKNTTGFKPNSPIEVLLEMTPKQAEILSFAERAGIVSLDLMDTEQPEEKGNFIESLLDADSTGDFQSALITYMMRGLFSNVNIYVRATPKGYIVSGKVPDPQMAGKIIEVLTKLSPGGDTAIVDLMEVDPQQVLICVKVMEVTKNIMANSGLNWQLLYQNAGEVVGVASFYPPSGTQSAAYLLSGSGINFGKFALSYLINLLQQDNVGKVLAEPNLTTVSGATAHFFAGGEFPILIPQGGNLIGTVTVDFKKFGVLLDFTPTVDLNGLITMHIVPEISTIDPSLSVTLQGFVIPGLVTRRVDTVVKLWPGQCYIIGGMLQDELTEEDSHLFGLSKLPVIGALFSSKSYQDQQTELVLIITPYLITSEKEEPCETACEYLQREQESFDLEVEYQIEECTIESFMFGT